MNEKILAKGRFSKINPLSLLFFMLAGFAFVMMFIVATIIDGEPGDVFKYMDDGYYCFLIGIAVFVIFGLIFLGMRFELIVTEGKITGKTLFGKRVDLPISQISATGTGIFNRVSIATSSGAINFYGVINQNEVFSAISELLMKRQEETKISTKVPESASDELKKFKELLDAGIITQEEFDAKKKQLLGL